MRVGVVTPIPTPYRDPFWNAFSRTPGVDLTVFYCSAGKSDRPWTEGWENDFRSEVLPGRNLLSWRGADASCFWNPGIRNRLAAGQFDALLIGGYNHPTMWAALRFAVRRRIPFFLMCESHLRKHRSGWKQTLKRPVLRWIVKRAAGFLPTGRLSAEFLQYYGADPRAMTALPNVPDLVCVRTQVQALRGSAPSPLPAELAGRPVVLFVGRLIPKKRAELVIRAFAEIDARLGAVLAIVGDGPLRPELEVLADQLGIRSRVHFAGFVQPREVLRWYALARVFVLPSSETWGVVVLESLAAGVPVIVSDEVGCVEDVVRDPALGTVVPARSQEALRDALQRELHREPPGTDFQLAWQVVETGMRYDSLRESLLRGIRAGIGRSRAVVS